MAKTNYIYQGPECHVTLSTGNNKQGTDIHLINDASIQLPAEHSYVKGLVALGRLQESRTADAVSIKQTKQQGAA